MVRPLSQDRSRAATNAKSAVAKPEVADLPPGLSYVSDHDPGIRRRTARGAGFNYFSPDGSPVTDERTLDRIRGLNEIARRRGQSLAQMAIAWVLRDPRVTSALIGARSVEQLDDSLDALGKLAFDEAELREIDAFAREGDVDLWADSEALTPADLPKPRLG